MTGTMSATGASMSAASKLLFAEFTLRARSESFLKDACIHRYQPRRYKCQIHPAALDLLVLKGTHTKLGVSAGNCALQTARQLEHNLLNLNYYCASLQASLAIHKMSNRRRAIAPEGKAKLTLATKTKPDDKRWQKAVKQ